MRSGATWGWARDAIALVVVSRLSEEMKARGIEDAIRAVERLNDPRVRLIIVGTGDAEERLRAIAAAVNARLGQASVVFAGPLSDPRPAYDAADVVLGMGSSAARGLAFGKPLIVLGERGWSAVFREPDTEAIFRNSFWSPQERPRRRRPAVRAPAGTRRRIRPSVHGSDAAARRFAEANFGLPAMAGRLAAVYEDALRSASTRAWIGDLRMEARILAAKLERTADRSAEAGSRADGVGDAGLGAAPHDETPAAHRKVPSR